MEDLKLIVRYVSIILLVITLVSGYTFPAGAPHVRLVNDGVEYEIYFAGSNYRDAFIYDADAHMLINCYSSTITGYTTVSGIQRTASFPVYDYGNIRINDSYPATYVYLNQVTECDFINFSEYAFWKQDIQSYLMVFLCIVVFITFLKR